MISATAPSAAAATAATRQAVPLLEPRRHVRDRVDPEAAEGDDQLCEPREPVRVEVAEHHHPLATGAGAGDPLDDERPRQAGAGDRAAPRSQARGTRRAPPRPPRRDARGRSRRTSRGRPPWRPPGTPARAASGPGRPSGDGRRSWDGACHAPLTGDLPVGAGRDVERVVRRGDEQRIRAPAVAGPRDHVAARRLGLAASAARRRLSSHSCHTTSSGLALKIDE